MEKRQLGKTDISLPVLGFGAMELRHMEEPDAIYLLGSVLDAGISFIDTSPDYNRSEEFIGKAISHRREEFILATKCGCDLWSGKGGHIFTREQFVKNLDNSLKLLRTDYIDLLQIHAAMPHELDGPLDDAIIFLQELKKAGKIGAFGISFRNGNEKEALYPAGFCKQCFEGFAHYDCFDSMQSVYGALTRDCEEDIAAMAAKGTGIIARGLLNRYTPAHKEKLETANLQELCASGETINSLLIRFVISNENVTSGITGSSSAAHMRENFAAAQRGTLPDDIYAEMKKRLA